MEIVRIGVAGLGTVGSAVIRLLEDYSCSLQETAPCQLKVVAISGRDKTKKRDFSTENIKWYDNPVELAASNEIDIFVELIGGAEGVAKDAVEAALRQGHHVVSANKALLVRYGETLSQLAQESQQRLAFEAAVAGGIPIIKIMQESLIANKVRSFYGIFNGTSNYILSHMAKKNLSFRDCLEKAQHLGYAEADPSFDIEGKDTAHKLALLASIAFDCFISDKDIHCEGIEQITLNDIRAAEALGYKIKLLAVAAQTQKGRELSVYPALIDQDSQLAKVDGVTNAILVNTDLLGSLFISGPGAGGMATASSVISDIVDIVRTGSVDSFRPCFTGSQSSYRCYEPYIQASGYFIRLTVQDKAGVFAQIAQRMAENDISLESILQRAPFDDNDDETKMVILATHQAQEASILKAFAAIKEDGYLRAEPKILRIKHLA